MRLTAIWALCAPLALLACQTVVDADALPAAESAQALAIDVCTDRRTRGELATMRQYMECGLAAQRNFAVAIKLTKMELFENYRQRVLLLADSYDDGRIASTDVYFERLEVLGQDYWRSVNDAHVAQEEVNQRPGQIIGAVLTNSRARALERDRYGPRNLQCSNGGGGVVNCRGSDGSNYQCRDSGSGRPIDCRRD